MHYCSSVLYPGQVSCALIMYLGQYKAHQLSYISVSTYCASIMYLGQYKAHQLSYVSVSTYCTSIMYLGKVCRTLGICLYVCDELNSLIDADVVDLHAVIVPLHIPGPLPGLAGVEELLHRRNVRVTVTPGLLESPVSTAVHRTVGNEPIRASNRNVKYEVELCTDKSHITNV